MDNYIRNMRIIGSDTPADRLLNKYFVPHIFKAFIEIGDNKFCMPIDYKRCASMLYKFSVRDDDTYIMGFPRSGTTWVQEMIWLIVNDLNFEGSKKKQTKHIPLLEIDIYTSLHLTDACSKESNHLTYINDLPSPRCIKTHLQWSLLPEEILNGSKKPKIIYVLRNPKDVCVSYYNFHRLFMGYGGSFEDFCELFLKGRITSGPFWESILSFWEQRQLPNILFITYKAMKEDIRCVISEIAQFLGKELNEIQIEQLVAHLDIDSMRKNPAINNDDIVEKYSKPLKRMVSETNNFIGRGEVNGYLKIMSPELIFKFDEWSKHHLNGTCLTL